ncbi:related to DNA repair and recombination protein RAD52 [Saccharomycodes ludwigii]|uniref:DNA repair and recombination protein RAD52 n=1 Tax=Saccharomycodes ludwigii TaxID=36035 RepID=A0A376B8T9_9ASCO|nr:related to DNA repair and recombination protein RAD52 [Saccharomycodes ludwigii]
MNNNNNNDPNAKSSKSRFNTSIDDIQAKLEKKLGPEYISKRLGYGNNRVAYLEGWKAINLANQIFGYNGWSTEVKSVTIDFMDEKQGRYFIGCTAIVRVTLTDGTFREDIGYGTIDNEKRKALAFERAKKSAVTDALKRSLRGFGNALGNCLYDKDFLSKIDKVKFDPPDFDENNLLRFSDEVPNDSLAMSSRPNTLSANGESQSRQQQKKRKIETVQKVNIPMTSNSKNITNEEKNNNNNNNFNVYNNKKINTINTNKADTNTTTTNNNTTRTGDKSTVIAAPVPSMTNTSINEYIENYLDDSLLMSDDLPLDDDDINTITNIANSSNANITNINNNNNKDASTNADSILIVSAKTLQNLNDGKTHNSNNIPVFDHTYKSKSIKTTIDQSVSKPLPRDILKERGVTAQEHVYNGIQSRERNIDEVTNANNNNGTSINTNTTASSATINSTNNNSTINHTNNNNNNNNNTTTNNGNPLKNTNNNRHISNPASNNNTNYNAANNLAPRKEVGRPKIAYLNLRNHSNPRNTNVATTNTTSTTTHSSNNKNSNNNSNVSDKSAGN